MAKSEPIKFTEDEVNQMIRDGKVKPTSVHDSYQMHYLQQKKEVNLC